MQILLLVIALHQQPIGRIDEDACKADEQRPEAGHQLRALRVGERGEWAGKGQCDLVGEADWGVGATGHAIQSVGMLPGASE